MDHRQRLHMIIRTINRSLNGRIGRDRGFSDHAARAAVIELMDDLDSDNSRCALSVRALCNRLRGIVKVLDIVGMLGEDDYYDIDRMLGQLSDSVGSGDALGI